MRLAASASGRAGTAPSRSGRQGAARRLASALAPAAAALALVAASAPPAAAATLPSYAQVRAAHRPSDITLLDRHGTPLQTLRLDGGVRRLPWVALADMSPALLQAVVLSEDKRFWEHSGVDWPAVARSAWANVIDRRTRGASTLTMQLAGLIDDGLARPAGRRSVAQKIGQVLTAAQLEAQWRKSEILEAYLNAVPFRGEIVGIGALAQTLFAKHPSGLDAQEAAIAAVLLRAPNAAAPRVAERACGVLRLQRLACTDVPALAAAALARRGAAPLGEQLAPHLARQLLRADGPAAQPSTLDAPLQRVALAALHQQLADLAGRHVEDGAVVVLDNASGEVLAWVGSSGGDFSEAPQVDGVLARRQPGSTLKPFVYGLAFERRLLTPASLIDDSPAQIATAGGLYLPQNYDRGFRGAVSVRTALGASLNVPAVRAAALLGPDALHQRLNQLGLGLSRTAGYYGQALALGGVDVTLLSLANAYRTLANGGWWSAPLLRPGTAEPRGRGAGAGAAPRRASDAAAAAGRQVADAAAAGRQVADAAAARRHVADAAAAGRQVADAAATYLVTDILADDAARAGTFGLGSVLSTTGFAAVKTGTSKDLRDNWCVGFTDRYTIGVWVGNASGEPMHDVSGISGAAPVWQAVARWLHQGRPSQPPPLPPGVVARRIAFDGGREPPRDELFVAGTEQAVQRAARPRFGIDSPRDGSVFALDPDIPPAAQRITFDGTPGTWVLDGRRLGRGARLRWAPWPGRHELVLLGDDGRELQKARFEVRGATAKRDARAAPRSTAGR